MFFYNSKRGKLRDADNASKPICDALQGIAYGNDNQVTNRSAKLRDISGTYRIKGASRRILDAIARGEEVVVVKIEREGEDLFNL